MGEIFLSTINSILPIVLLILLGYLLKRIGLLNKSFLKVGNTLVFKIFLPCMLFVNIYEQMDSFSDIPWRFVLYCLVMLVVIFFLGILLSLIFTKQKNRRGVMTQCTFRCNFAIIGLVLIQRLGGSMAAGGMVSAFSAPLCNILSVIGLSIFMAKDAADNEGAPLTKSSTMETVKAKAKSVGKILLNIIKNPIIIGVVVALICVGIREIERAATGGDVPFRLDTQLKFLYTAISDIKTLASPFALIVLGGQFEFTAVKGMTKETIVGTVARLVIAPLIGIGVAFLLDHYTNFFAGEIDYATLIAIFATPVAVASAVMAGEMGGDRQLATQYVVWTSVFSIVTIFAIVFMLMSFGLISV